MAPSESEASLHRALRTLRAIRRRYATGREAHPVARFYTVQVALGAADMLWLTAAIVVLEKALGGAATEAAEAADQAHPPDVNALSAAHLAAVVSQLPEPQPLSDHPSSIASVALAP